MALNLSQKQEVVAELSSVAATAHSLIAAEYAGTTVSQMTAMMKASPKRMFRFMETRRARRRASCH